MFQLLCGWFVIRGRCEFMSEFAEPYAALVICSLVGAPNDHWRELVDMSADMGLALGVTYAQDEEKIDAATTRLFQFAENLVFERKRNPRDDFICALVNANENKDALSDQELYDMIVLSIFGGIDTTRNQLGLAMSMFIDHPDQWSLLAGNPDLARPAVEEVMRMRPTATWVTREATQDFNYKGIHISQGTTIHLFSESSATDPDHFEPGFDITADRQRHFGFGGGKHHCIGSPIARGDMSEALKLLAHELTGLNYDGHPVWLPDSGNTGPVTLPISFDKRQK